MRNSLILTQPETRFCSTLNIKYASSFQNGEMVTHNKVSQFSWPLTGVECSRESLDCSGYTFFTQSTLNKQVISHAINRFLYLMQISRLCHVFPHLLKSFHVKKKIKFDLHPLKVKVIISIMTTNTILTAPVAFKSWIMTVNSWLVVQDVGN